MFLKQTRFRRPRPKRDWLRTIVTGVFVIGSAVLVGLELPHVF